MLDNFANGDEIKPVSASASQAALDRLHIRYRKLDLASGVLFFCTLYNGMTFDLFETHTGRIKLWRFVGLMPPEVAGTRCEYRPLETPHFTIGYEVDEEGNICFYASSICGITNSQMKGTERIIAKYAKETLI